ncbi:diaminopimelate epimerase [Corynebacterium sp. HS2168-gen11]|uniref:diaminopimelate epimerase n=1 Tax=Corynebacterium sp. HS2168-gen11 TaxID=2974027 RepID=UPI00216B1598|nr:diaminopimelate epimerase [Corynebacterium sp. HS2168-gen11]MCS4536357.1 diaminopimelate epimerase [Corynebacterium sp. HS2168-gen11]
MHDNKLPATLEFFKGHGTENDFVILHDPHAELPLSAALVAKLCDRRAGIGADGLLRVARAGSLLRKHVLGNLPAGVEENDWFMDYYNADGSIAEMCGNGTRVFAHFVQSRGLIAESTFTVGTRAGGKRVTVHSANTLKADVSVEMGNAAVTGVSTCQIGDTKFAGMGVDMGNPHLACVVPNLTVQQLRELKLEQPEFDREFFPAGVNVEIVTPISESAEEVSMRVYERGVGETRSCGTGTVAAARAALADIGKIDGTVTVHVLGGTVEVTIDNDRSTLRGPSRIVAEGSIYLESL